MYKNKIIVIGLTGGTGAGKGEVSLAFMSNGVRALDTDKVSRLVSAPGQPCLAELADYFGSTILREDGTLDRKHLASIVFGEPDEAVRAEKLSMLNRITHRHIIEEINNWLERRSESGDRIAVIDAPQLFESGFDKNCDYIIGVIADEDIRIRRIMARDAISREAAEARIRSQRSDEFFIQNCNFVVYNNGGVDALERQVNNILKKIAHA